MNYAANIIVCILRGISGAGKSTLVRKLQAELLLMDWDSFKCSADDFFMVAGEYRFDARKLSQAHPWCFNQFLLNMGHAKELLHGEGKRLKGCVIFIDNTNTQIWECSPYYLAAESQGYKPVLLHIKHDVDTCVIENLHGVPEESIKAMEKRFERRLPWYDEIEITRKTSIDWILEAVLSKK